jgi:hypothetical protein
MKYWHRRTNRGKIPIKGTLIVCSLLIGASLGCNESNAPMLPAANGLEIVATVVIDTCSYVSTGALSVLDSLCGRSSIVTICPMFVYPDVKSRTSSDKIRTLLTGPAYWTFSNPHFQAVLPPLFDGRSLRIRARTAIGTGESSVWVSTGSGRYPGQQRIIGFGGSFKATLDGNGFPIIDTVELKEGSVSMLDYARASAEGRATARISLSQLPIEDDREPPVVARPYLKPEELAAAPSVLQLGDKTLLFQNAVFHVPYGSGERNMYFSIIEESYYYVDEVRMDFVWVVQETDMWEPEIRSVWNSTEFGASATDGPNWPLGKDVDIVVGFVDSNGDVLLVKTTRTLTQDF